jgi:hypothetical protein
MPEIRVPPKKRDLRTVPRELERACFCGRILTRKRMQKDLDTQEQAEFPIVGTA